MTLKAVPGGWINTDFEVKPMITQERKSKYKHKVMVSPSWAIGEHTKMKEWCEENFGPGGRSKKFRWRFGWTEKHTVRFEKVLCLAYFSNK